MGANRVTLSSQGFVVAPTRLLRENKNYIWIFLILLERAGGSGSASISGPELIKLSQLPAVEIKQAIDWLIANGYIKKIAESSAIRYLLSIEGVFCLQPEPSASNAFAKNVKSPRKINVARSGRKFIATIDQLDSLDISEQLKQVSSIICDFFNNHKGGVKTRRSFEGLLNSLTKILNDPGGGIDAVKKQLQLAIEKSKSGEAKWDSITYQNWDKFGREKSIRREENTRPSTQQIISTFEEDIADYRLPPSGG